MEWIPVSQALPDEGLYLVWIASVPLSESRCGLSWFDGEWDEDYGYCEKVTHWQPLPDPPKED